MMMSGGDAMTLSQMRIRRPRSLAFQVHDALVDGLASGELMPCGRIVVEHLAEQLGVSPTPVREAVARLIQEGLVTEGTSGKLQVVPLTPGYVHDTFLVRSRLEGLAAELAAPRLSATQLTELREDHATTDAALDQGNYEVYIHGDATLHRTIYEVSGNQVLAREISALEAHINYIRGYSQRRAGDHIRRSHAEHGLLIEALAAGDPDAARQAMETHINQARDRIITLIDFGQNDS